MDLELFRQLLDFDSTSGREREVALWLSNTLQAPSRELMEVGDGTLNLLLSWGRPEVVFCTHMDTVPPYIPPTFRADEVLGRGSCDAKGQILAMYTACKRLESAGHSGFALLLLAGEETGSWGAKAFSKTGFRAPFLVVGEPTENKMVSASKGTASFDVEFTGKAFHSGYPQFGVSAVDLFNDFYNKLKAVDWGEDPELGNTTWNVGLLLSDNPQNVLSPKLSCRIYFRTTFASAGKVGPVMEEIARSTQARLTARGGDAPARYVTLEGIPSAPVAFGSDAPHLSGFGHKMIVGPGTIRVAHREDEHILIRDLEDAVDIYTKIFLRLAKS